MDWETLKAKYKSKYPDDNFWKWLQGSFPNGLPKDIATHFTPDEFINLGGRQINPGKAQLETTLLNKYYKQYDQVARPLFEQAAQPSQTQVTNYGYQNIQSKYLNGYRANLDTDLADGVINQDEYNTLWGNALQAVGTYGVRSDVGLIDFDKIVGNEWTLWKDYVGRFGKKIDEFGVYDVNGIYYDSNGSTVPQQQQQVIRDRVKSVEEAEKNAEEGAYKAAVATQQGKADEAKAWDAYRNFRDQWSRIATGSNIVNAGQPHDDNDVLIARTPAEARIAGFSSYVYSGDYEKLQPSVEQLYLRNLRIISVRKIGAGGAGQIKPMRDVFASLTDAEHNQARQMALQEAMSSAGVVAKQAGVRIKSERSPLPGPSVVSMEEYQTMKNAQHKKEQPSQLMEQLKKRQLKDKLNNLAAEVGLSRNTGAKEFTQLYSGLINKNLSGKPEALTPEPGGKTPSWVTSFIQGAKTGEPLVLGRQMTPLSPQQAVTMLPSQQQFLQGYAQYSKQAFPHSKTQPWIDIDWAQNQGQQQGGNRTSRNKVTKQRA